MTKPRLTKEEINSLSRGYGPGGVTARLIDEHAAAMALLGLIYRDHRELRSEIEALGIGKKAPTLEEFNDCIKSGSPLVSCYAHSFTDFTAFVSRDGTKLARVTAEHGKLFVCATTTNDTPRRNAGFEDAPSAVEFVAKFLGVES